MLERQSEARYGADILARAEALFIVVDPDQFRFDQREA